MKKDFLKLFIRSVALTLIVSAIGLAFNMIYSEGVQPFKKFKAPGEVLQEDPRTIINPSEVKDIWDSGVAIFIDTRNYSDYIKGHIAGSFALPYNDLDNHFMKIRDFLDPSFKIVVYCDGQDCLSSLHVADFLNRNGFQDVNIFFGGWELWEIQGYPTEEGEGF